MLHGKKNRSLLFLVILTLCYYHTHILFSKTPDEAEFRAAQSIGEEIALWLSKRDPQPNSLGVFSVHPNLPLDKEYGLVVEGEILKYLTKMKFKNVMGCSECHAPQILVRDDRLIISKGTPDLDALKEITKREPVETFLTVELFRSSFYVIAEANLYDSQTGSVLSAERFEIPAINFADTAVQFLMTAGTGTAQAVGSSIGPSVNSANIDLTLLEDIGFGKGGLNIGTYFGGSGGSLVYLDPTLAFGSRFGLTNISWAITLGGGYGFDNSGSNGFMGRAGLEIFLGSWTVVGIDGIYYNSQSSLPTTTTGFYGAHVGLYFGR